jgi:hypothetical protein
MQPDMVRNYRLCFGSPAGREVLQDLMEFCRFGLPLIPRDAVRVDPNEVLLHEGGRRVFLRIITALAFNIEQIEAVISRQRFKLEEDQDAA